VRSVASQGGAAAVATPLMGPISDVVVSTLGDSVLVDVGMHTGFELSAKAANSAVGDKVTDKLSGPALRSWRSFTGNGTPGWATTGVKNVSITLMYKGIPSDAACVSLSCLFLVLSHGITAIGTTAWVFSGVVCTSAFILSQLVVYY
jgi:hypothetical protein